LLGYDTTIQIHHYSVTYITNKCYRILQTCCSKLLNAKSVTDEKVVMYLILTCSNTVKLTERRWGEKFMCQVFTTQNCLRGLAVRMWRGRRHTTDCRHFKLWNTWFIETDFAAGQYKTANAKVST